MNYQRRMLGLGSLIFIASILVTLVADRQLNHQNVYQTRKLAIPMGFITLLLAIVEFRFLFKHVNSNNQAEIEVFCRSNNPSQTKAMPFIIMLVNALIAACSLITSTLSFSYSVSHKLSKTTKQNQHSVATENNMLLFTTLIGLITSAGYIALATKAAKAQNQTKLTPHNAPGVLLGLIGTAMAITLPLLTNLGGKQNTKILENPSSWLYLINALLFLFKPVIAPTANYLYSKCGGNTLTTTITGNARLEHKQSILSAFQYVFPTVGAVLYFAEACANAVTNLSLIPVVLFAAAHLAACGYEHIGAKYRINHGLLPGTST